MSYRNNGIVSTGFPSLYDAENSAESTDKSLSILSAVTGKEIAKPVPQHKTAISRRTISLYLLFIGTMLGFTYWQYNNAKPGGWIASVITPAPVTATAPPKVAANAPVAGAQRSQPAKVDAAIIEKVSEKPAVHTTPNQAPDAQAAVGQGTRPPANAVGAKTSSPTKPTLATSTAPAKTGQKNNAKAASVARIEKRRALPERSVQPVQSSRPAKQADAPQQLAKSTERTAVASAHPDPDEKLLEGMLRLMKRERTNEAARVRSTK